MADPGRTAADGRSVADLFGEVTDGLSRLLRQELDLARTEMVAKASATGKDVGLVAGGGFVVYAGFLTLIAALVLILGQILPLWISALVVGLLVVGGGYLLIRAGLAGLRRLSVTPEKTVETMQDNARWAKEQVT